MKKVFFLLFILIVVGLYEWQRHLEQSKPLAGTEIPADFNEDDFAEMESIHPAENSLVVQISNFNPPSDAKQQARNATVLIHTPWGKLGSGFILDTACYAVTHKQLLQIDASELIIERERIKETIKNIQQEIDEIQKEYDYVTEVDGFGDNARLLDQEMQSLARVENKLQSQLEKLDVTTSRTDFSITLIDGTEFVVDDFKLSDQTDLAFFKIPSNQCPHINFGYPSTLKAQQTVLMIGKANKFDHSINHGEFIETVGINDNALLKLMTNGLKINVGGPVLDKYGYVIGLIVPDSDQNTDSIFAIPMQIVLNEFRKYHNE